MRNLILKLTLVVAIFSSLFMAPIVANAALDCTKAGLTAKEQIQCGACGAAGASTCKPDESTKTLNQTVKDVINVISVFAGAIAVIMIIVGGFRYITSAGNPEGTKSARNTIVYAVVGLIVIALAQIIVHFVLNSVT